MKRVAAIVLSLIMLVMLLPVGSIANAEKVAAKPFYALNFQGITVDAPYLYELTSIYTPRTTDPNNPRDPSYGSARSIKQIAKAIKEEFDERPDGTRFILFDMLRASTGVAENIIYLDRPIEITREWLTSFLSEYKRIGGKLDGIIVDLEYSDAESYYLWKRIYKGSNPNIYADIVNDPRYKTRIRPLLEERGFKFWEDNSKPEIWSIYADASGAVPNYLDYANCGTIWNNVINEVLVDAINESTFEPLIQFYPDAILSDYQRPDFKGWLKHVDDYGTVRFGNVSKAGNASNFNTYTNRIANGFYGSTSKPVYNKVPGYNNAVYGSDPFYMTLWDANLFKTIYSATDTGLVNAWVGGYTGYWSNGNICSTSETPYYSESIFHIAMLNQQPIMGYINQSYEKYDEYDPDNEYDACLNVLSDIMAELTRVAGAADRKAIPTPATWNGNYVLSGMYAGGRNIWRITPNTEVKSLKDFKIKDKAPTFSIDGQTIVFPQGRIIEDGDVREVDTCGYWIETPANVMPVITSETDRYSKYPSFGEDFAQYKAGKTFSSSSALPKNCWQVSGSALKIEANSGNNALAMTGTATVKNVNLPQNITAGDSYAKQQAWEVSFTLPAGLSANAELRLLATTDNGGGILIKNGKVYHDKSGTYQELSGVTLSAGKYTVKREVDFRTAGAFTSSYYIYDANGKLLGQAKNILVANISLPITSIVMSCANVNGKVLIDDYKLYPIGVTTDFEIYDAELGYKLGDVNDARTEDTAYRLSWMNATNEQKVAYVYNVKTGSVIEKVDMAPGQDGVATGVVKVKAGSTVQLAVKTEKGNAPTYPNYDNGDFTWAGFEENVEIPEENPGGNTQPTTPPATQPTTPPATQPTTPPATQPTTPPATQPTTPPATQPTTPPATQPTTPPVTDPDVTEPDSTQPDATEPDSTQPDATEPDSTQPDATEPDSTQPDSTTPTGSTPPTGNTNPNGTEPGGDNNNTGADTKKGLTGGQIALIVIICVLLAGGGVAAFLVIKKKKEAEAAPVAAAAESANATESTEG